MVQLSLTSILPATLAYQYSAPAQAEKSLSGTITEVHQSSCSLSETEKELFHWHK